MWRRVIDNHKPKSSTFVCCRERELRGFVHGDDFIIITGEYVHVTWIESRLTDRDKTSELQKKVDGKAMPNIIEAIRKGHRTQEIQRHSEVQFLQAVGQGGEGLCFLARSDHP